MIRRLPEPTRDELEYATHEYLEETYGSPEWRAAEGLRLVVEALTEAMGAASAAPRAATPAASTQARPSKRAATRPAPLRLVPSPAWVEEAKASLPALCTTDEAMRLLRTSRRTLYRWIAAGKIKAVKTGAGGSSRVHVPRAAIAEYLAGLEGA